MYGQLLVRLSTSSGTPWDLLSAAQKRIKETSVSQSFLTNTLTESKKHYVDIQLQEREHINFDTKEWMQSD